ncbi:HTTM domain-containing protein [Georgenia daeguensis]|uniref:HTTM-like domain-containing protein n=1 Tax=Georgenia daeguensis TaxID=908355 RepID=A0ABP8ER23_9MICO
MARMVDRGRALNTLLDDEPARGIRRVHETQWKSLRLRLSESAQLVAEWFVISKHATYSLSILRILYGAAIVLHLVSNYSNRHYLWGAGVNWMASEMGAFGYTSALHILFPRSNPLLFDLSYGVLFMLAALFVIGWRTRAVMPILLAFWLGLTSNNPLVPNSGDTLMRLTLLFLLFADLSGCWSVDSWRRRRQVHKRSTPETVQVVSNVVHNGAVVLCGYQVLLVYVTSAFYKILTEEWRAGSALYYALSLDVFMPHEGLSEFVRQITPVVVIATVATVWIQFASPLLMLSRPLRVFALLSLLGMHLGIGLLLGLWQFSLVMIALDLLFVRDKSWRLAMRWAQEVGLLKRTDRTRHGPMAG